MLSWFKKKTDEAVEGKAADVVSAVEPVVEEKIGWLGRLTGGLSKTTSKITTGIADLITKRKLDDEALEQLEEVLIAADIGPRLAAQIATDFGKKRFGQDVSEDEIKQYLANTLTEKLQPVASPLVIDESKKPFVILMVGVNGAGKTTTLGKLSAQLKQQGKSVWLAAGDTFRAAAVAQLQTWGDRAGVPVIAGVEGADASGLAYDAYQRAKAANVDVLMIDTAGRLQNRTELMAGLQKIIRVIQKIDAEAPHATLLVLDATTGQNALSQASVFKELVNVSGLIITKLDGTAKGGIVVALADQHKLPILAVGVGESIDDLQPFNPQDFARALVGLTTN